MHKKVYFFRVLWPRLPSDSSTPSPYLLLPVNSVTKIHSRDYHEIQRFDDQRRFN